MSDNNFNLYEGGPGNGSSGNNGNNNGNNGNGGPGRPGGPGSNDPKKQSFIILIVAALVTLLSISVFMKLMTGTTNQEISYNEFISMVENGEVESVQVDSDKITIYPKKQQSDNPFLYAYGGSVSYYTGRMEDDDALTARLLKYDVEMNKQVADSSSLIMTVLLY
jgi:cell division protease FtsH